MEIVKVRRVSATTRSRSKVFSGRRVDDASTRLPVCPDIQKSLNGGDGSATRSQMIARQILAVGLLLGVAGCTTLYSEGQVDPDAQRDLTIRNLQGQVNRLQENVNDTQAQREELDRRMEQAEADARMAQLEQQNRIAELERRLAALDQARERDRNEIVTKVADIVKTSSGGGVRTANGYEHPVQAGETLSAIAAAYKVSAAAIIKANNLKNPDNLRVGQKLFIPE